MLRSLIPNGRIVFIKQMIEKRDGGSLTGREKLSQLLFSEMRPKEVENSDYQSKEDKNSSTFLRLEQMWPRTINPRY